MKKRFLQHFAVGAGGSGGQGGAAGSGSGSGGNAGAANGGHGSAGYTYEQLEEVATSRAERASRAALADFFRKQGMSEEEITTAINDYKTKKQASQPDVAKLTKERDDALRKLQERDNMELLRSKGVPQDYLEFAAFKINALVDDKTTFEKAAEKWLKENPRYTGSGYHVASSSTSGNTQGSSGSSNASINDRIRAAARR